MAKWPEGSILFGARGHTAVDFPGHTEPSHSLFGVVGQIAMETGWSLNRILDTNVVMLNLMMADAPHYVPERNRSMADMIREMKERERQRNHPPQAEEPDKGVDPMTYFSRMAVQD